MTQNHTVLLISAEDDLEGSGEIGQDSHSLDLERGRGIRKEVRQVLRATSPINPIQPQAVDGQKELALEAPRGGLCERGKRGALDREGPPVLCQLGVE